MINLSQTVRKRGYLLATGQVTSYGSGTGVDDGALQKGIVKAYTVLTTGQYSGNINIVVNSKTDVHANACVVDNNTGLMWSRTFSASVGPASNGLLPWTTTGSGATAEGIFPYCAAANAASLAGYSDWRIPNIAELYSVMYIEAAVFILNSVAFPGFSNGTSLLSSSTNPNTTSNFLLLGASYQTAKSINAGLCILVRG